MAGSGLGGADGRGSEEDGGDSEWGEEGGEEDRLVVDAMMEKRNRAVVDER